MRHLVAALPIAALAAAPAQAAGGPFFSLGNTDFVVLIAFLIFVGVLIYFKVPGLLGGLLDKRAEGIRHDLDAARALREEAQALLTSYERKAREAAEQAERIVKHARQEAEEAAEAAKVEMARSVERRLQAAGDQIASAEAAALRAVRERAVAIAVAAASEVIARKMSAKDDAALIDAAIADVGSKLH
ncbi:MAG: ATP F0F1 synthase subunit B [Alphaproteobacteria bacterium HGW-Alphaproteobacteria-2]|nr:MAG: ATP F0F1 synthase subunit B [Alphaproteobacteria bacterium HGW-Alphaproteobacteria-2]